MKRAWGASGLIVVALATLTTLQIAAAQVTPAQIVRTGDGSLYVVQAANAWNVVPSSISDEDLAALSVSGEIDGFLGDQTAPLAVDQGSDGRLYLAQAGAAWLLVPGSISDDAFSALNLVGQTAGYVPPDILSVPMLPITITDTPTATPTDTPTPTPTPTLTATPTLTPTATITPSPTPSTGSLSLFVTRAGATSGLPNVQLKLYPDPPASDTDPATATGVTDSSGTYAFTSVANGDYLLRADAPFIGFLGGAQLHLTIAGQAIQQKVVVTSVEPFACTPGFNCPEKTVEFDGKVVDTNGHPLNGAVVWLGKTNCQTTTSTTGAYRLVVPLAQLDEVSNPRTVLAAEKGNKWGLLVSPGSGADQDITLDRSSAPPATPSGNCPLPGGVPIKNKLTAPLLHP